MKKLIYCAAALATALFAGSCQQELLDTAQGGSTVTFSVEIPEVATKAEAVGSSASMIDDLVYAVYLTTATSIDEATSNWAGTTHLLYAKNLKDRFLNHSSDVVEVELLNGQNHIVLLWAQHNDVWVDEQGNDIDLTNITYPSVTLGLTAAECDKYAAFSAFKFIPATERTNNGTIELKRPFAQVNVATVDPAHYNVAITGTTLEVKGAGNAFNVAKQAAAETVNVTYNWSGKVFLNDPLTVDNKNYDHYLAMGYVFTSGNVVVDYTIDAGKHGVIKNTINAVPVKKNYRTNIIGNLLTSDVKYNVLLDKGWGQPETNVEVKSVASAQELLEAIAGGSTESETNIKIDVEPNADGEKILDLADLLTRSTVAENPYGLLIPEGKFVIDLNGCTVTQTKTCTNHYAMIKNNGKLSITDSQGSGKITFTDDGNGDPSFGWGSYTIENCGELVIEGGLIENATTLNPGVGNSNVHMYCAIQQNNAAATTIVNGGVISTPTYRSIRINAGALKINGGVCEGQVWMQPFAVGSSIEITDGDFSPRGNDGSSVFVENSEKTVGFAISGGYFRTKLGASNRAALKGVTGGTFMVDPSDYVADDYVAVYNEESQVYTIAEAYAKVGNAKFTSLNEAFEAAEDKATIEVLRDTEMTATEVPAGKTLTLDLNGKTVTGVDATSKNFGLISLSKQSVLTVKNGTMKVSATINSGWNRYSAVLANNQGTLNVENCTIEHLGGTDMAYGIDNLTNSNIGDAYLYVNSESNIKSTYIGIRQFLNCSNKMNSLVVENATVTGGRLGIWMQEPHANPGVGKLVVTETANVSSVRLSGKTSYASLPVEMSVAASAVVTGVVEATDLPEGYTVENVNGTWKVLAWTVAEDAASLAAACANGQNVILNTDLTDVSVQTTAPYGNWYGVKMTGGVLDGNGHTLDFEEGPKNSDGKNDNYGIMVSAGTIKNVKLSGVYRTVVIMYPTEDITIDNVIFDPEDEWGVGYSINTAEGDGTHSLFVKNSLIAGWNSFGTAIKDLTFTNCQFVQGAYYTNVFGRLSKPYVNTVYENCDFCSKYYIDLSSLAADQTVTLKNCTVNGVKLTAENWTSLVAPEDTCGEGQISIELKNGSYMTAENVADYVVFE